MQKRLSINAFIMFLIITGAAFATEQGDSVRQQFFDTITTTLRADYRLCTADSGEKPLSFLLAWRTSIDSFATSAGYHIIVRKFVEETGISATDARPCEIVEWMRADALRKEEVAQLLAAERDSIVQLHNDSVYLTKELQNTSRQGYDVAEIPFGLPLRAILLFARNNNIDLFESDGGTIIIDPVIIGTVHCRTALHLSKKEDRYTWYEMESRTCGPDSLDSWARPIMDSLSANIETRTAQPPTHVYRVGRFDIVPGRLAICRLWEFPDAFVYTGLARTGNRFYAKSIVWQK